MQISENWLREWVTPVKSGKELAHQITMAGLEVDALHPAVPDFTGVVIAEVRGCKPHPDADKLTLCDVDDGTDQYQVVCGAANVREGIKVPFARVGALLPEGMKIRKAKLRGQESFGMLCGASELGLEDKIDGLLELPASAPLGTDIHDYLQLDDQLIEIDLTPNRADCLSIRGVAREVAALDGTSFVEPATEPVAVTLDASRNIRLDAPAACPRYLGRVIAGVDVSRPSPLWLVEKLRRSGIRSVDIIVDITNLVLLELGQPLHAFDQDTLDGDICVRLAREGETLQLLNDQEIKPETDTLVITDNSGPIALAGIMGGAKTAVSETTCDIFLECAYFTPLALAGQARRYGLHTDASHRYERGVDWQLQQQAIEKASALILELAGGEAGPVTSACDETALPNRSVVTFTAANANRFLSLDIPAVDMAAMLKRLGFDLVDQTEGQWQVTAPSWRFDIAGEEDLIEEVARLYGFERLPSRLPRLSGQPLRHKEKHIPVRRLADLLTDRGYREAITYSFVDPDVLAMIEPKKGSLALLNPISREQSVMRTSLWPGLLTAAGYNLNRQIDSLRLFETGLRFVEQNNELTQEAVLSGLCCGVVDNNQWQGSKHQVDFYDIKGDIEALIALTADAARYRFAAAEHTALHPGQSAALYRDDRKVGLFGRIHPSLAKKMGITDSIYLFEIALSALAEEALPAFMPLSGQPAVRRDLAFVISNEIPAARIVASLEANAPDCLQSLRIFDVYQGDNLPAGEKSLAVAISFQAADRTLKEVEINNWVDRMVLVLKQEFKAQLRE